MSFQHLIMALLAKYVHILQTQNVWQESDDVCSKISKQEDKPIMNGHV